MISLRKLAQLAGVNPSTVTRALRNERCISEGMRARIHALAAEYHYHPNRLTQSLMSGRSSTIGVLIPSVVTPYSSRMLAGILGTAEEQEYRVLIKETHGRPADTHVAIQMCIEQRVEGLLLDTGHLEAVPRKPILELRSHQIIPIGLDATTFETEVDRVHTDEQALTLQAVDYLLHLGHRNIAFVGRTIAGRFSGRAHYIARAFQTRLLSPRDFINVQDEPPYTSLPAERLLMRLLAQSSPPTAIIAWEDPIAVLLLNAAVALSVRVPQKLSILGFGNLPFASLVTPKLTSFEQHPEQVGREAFLLFARRAQASSGDGVPTAEAIAIRPTLVIRESCGPAPERSIRKTSSPKARAVTCSSR